MDETKNLMKNLLSDISGVKTNKIKIGKEIKKKKKKRIKKKKKIEIKDGVDIDEDKYANYVDFSDIRKSRNYKKKNLDDWVAINFVFLSKGLYYDIYKTDCNLNAFPACKEVNKLKDVFFDLYGFNSNRLIYDYIVYFFENFIKYFMREKGVFYFSQLTHHDAIESFYNNYDFEKALHKKTKVKNHDLLTNVKIEKSYLLNEENLVYNYGIIIAINWLIVNKKMGRNMAVKMVYNIVNKMYNNGLFNNIKKITEQWSPYPNWLIFKGVNKFTNKIDKKLKIDVKFEISDLIDDKFEFLK